ncbi:hypothetical protein BKA62DRAFT_614472 [Auriculariales sp. MPI-PUGE-AT-0066]|nr:hypothetical protein BKA62DRAFT_614472 [Auriculariales sp. MPI-PUGE-AT-0066]
MPLHSTSSFSIPRRARGQNIDIGVRRVILYQSEILCYTPAQIAVSTDVPLRSVQLILQRWASMCEIIKEPRQERPGAKVLGLEARRFIISCFEHSPDLMLDELKDELWLKYRLAAPLSSLSRTLKEMNMPLKTLSKRACEASKEKRNKFIGEIYMEPPERLVFVDESAVNMLTGNRSRGRALKGKRAYARAPFTRHERYILLMKCSRYCAHNAEYRCCQQSR